MSPAQVRDEDDGELWGRVLDELRTLNGGITRLHGDLGAMRDDLRRMLDAFDRRTAVDEGRTQVVARVVHLATETTAGRALMVLLVGRVIFGSAADAVLVAIMGHALGVPTGAP